MIEDIASIQKREMYVKNALAQARDSMHRAPTSELTRYWFRIWRARRRTLGKIQQKLKAIPDDQVPF